MKINKNILFCKWMAVNIYDLMLFSSSFSSCSHTFNSVRWSSYNYINVHTFFEQVLMDIFFAAMKFHCIFLLFHIPVGVIYSRYFYFHYVFISFFFMLFFLVYNVLYLAHSCCNIKEDERVCKAICLYTRLIIN